MCTLFFATLYTLIRSDKCEFIHSEPSMLTFLLRIIIFRIRFCSGSCLTPISLVPNSKLSSQGRPPCPPPYLSSPTPPPGVQLLAVKSQALSRLIWARKWFTKRRTHTPSAHFSCLLIPQPSFLSPDYSCLSLFLGLKGNKIEPVCDYVSCLLVLEGHANIPLPEAV